MLFEKALYYPTIDIKNEGWLKSAILLWDHISTIVPDHELKPYKNDWSRVLNDAGLLIPHRVNPYSVNYPNLERAVREYLDSPSGKRSFKRRVNSISDNNRIYSIQDGLRSEKMREEYGDFCISVDKFGKGLKDVIEPFVNDNGYIISSHNFMNFYMTALANNICQHKSMALLTDMVYTSGLANSMLLDSPNKRMGKDLLKQGLMYKFIIQGIEIDPRTPIDKILSFREKYQYEMGDFRKQVSDLVSSQNTDGLSADEVVNQMARLYSMGVLPALKNIQKALDGQRVKWIAGGSTSIALTGVTSVLTQSVISPLSILAEAGIKVVYKAFNYNLGKEKTIMEKPYSFLYRIDRCFSKAGRVG